jgi:hypothetical protein
LEKSVSQWNEETGELEHRGRIECRQSSGASREERTLHVTSVSAVDFEFMPQDYPLAGLLLVPKSHFACRHGPDRGRSRYDWNHKLPDPHHNQDTLLNPALFSTSSRLVNIVCTFTRLWLPSSMGMGGYSEYYRESNDIYLFGICPPFSGYSCYSGSLDL